MKARRLKDAVFVNETANLYEKVKILNAIQVELVSIEEPDKTIPVKVDVVEFNEDYFKL